MAGYSRTPLFKKLGLKEGSRVRIKNAPENYLNLLGGIPESAQISTRLVKQVDIWHLFTKSRKEMSSQLEQAIHQIKQNGMIWVSWPKKASKISTDITEDVIREVVLPMGLVDVKVCAVDETWSGLKMVIRKELRT